MADQHIFGFDDLRRLLDGLADKPLDEHAKTALARATRALYQQQPPGRRQMNDRAAIRQIDELIATTGCSFYSAALKTARARHPFAENPKAIAERYRRKAKKGSTKR